VIAVVVRATIASIMWIALMPTERVWSWLMLTLLPRHWATPRLRPVKDDKLSIRVD
jgi:hypothetical protein